MHSTSRIPVDLQSPRHKLLPTPELIIALDVSTSRAAQAIVSAVGEAACLYKVGMQLYTAAGPQIVRDLVASGRHVFLDLKYHDIPNTVTSAVREAVQLGVSMLTVHASGGSKMLRAAVQATGADATVMVVGVTVLTSMDADDLETIGVTNDVAGQVSRLATMALANGCRGVVASAREAPMLRAQLGNGFAIVAPGVRPKGGNAGDQIRTVTPAEAAAAGVSHIVVGRPITGAANPAVAAREIVKQMLE